MDFLEDVHLPAPQVRRRYGRSDMWLWRLLQDEKSGFPKPLIIKSRRYWRLADLKRWELWHASKQGLRELNDKVRDSDDDTRAFDAATAGKDPEPIGDVLAPSESELPLARRKAIEPLGQTTKGR